jgi:hypothetical protein
MKQCGIEAKGATQCMEKFKHKLKSRFAWEIVTKTKFLKRTQDGFRMNLERYDEMLKKKEEIFERIDKMFEKYF